MTSTEGARNITTIGTMANRARTGELAVVPLGLVALIYSRVLTVAQQETHIRNDAMIVTVFLSYLGLYIADCRHLKHA